MTLQLLPPDHGGDTLSLSAAANALREGLQAVSSPERAAVFEALAVMPGASQRLEKKQFQSTWAGLGVGLVLGVGGCFVVGHFLSKR